MRWSMSRLSCNVERITLKRRGWHQGHRDCRNRNESRNRCTRGDFSIGQFARRCCWSTIRVELCSRFENVVDSKEFPHALCKVRIEVAMENRVAGSFVSIAATAVCDLGSERITRPLRLTIKI